MNQSIWAVVLAAICITPIQAQMVSAPPPSDARPIAIGGFVGARVLISLGGTRNNDQGVRAGLTVAPMQRSEASDFRGPAWRIGEGLEFGFRGNERAPKLSLAGQQLKGLKQRNNLSGGSTATLVIVGVVAAASIGLLVVLGDTKDNCAGNGECNNN